MLVMHFADMCSELRLGILGCFPVGPVCLAAKSLGLLSECDGKVHFEVIVFRTPC